MDFILILNEQNKLFQTYGHKNVLILPSLVGVVNQATLETVARVKSKKNDTKEEKYMLLTLVLHFTFRPCYTGLSVHFLKHLCFYFRFQLQNVFNLDSDNRAEDTPTLIDRKV